MNEQIEKALERLEAALPLLTDLEKAQLLGVAQGLAMMAEQRQKSA